MCNMVANCGINVLHVHATEEWDTTKEKRRAQFMLTLQNLADNGYQPMYNGRPSCPFCLNFVDEEETHETNCPLITFLVNGGC